MRYVQRLGTDGVVFQETPDNNNHGGNGGPVQQDFVPHVARVAKLMESRVILALLRNVVIIFH